MKILVVGDFFSAFISKSLCYASLAALSKEKSGVSPIAVGEVLRRLIAKCLSSDTKSKAIELFDSLQLGAGVSGGAKAIIHKSKITYDNIVGALSYEGVPQNVFQNAFNSVNRSHLLKSTCEIIPGIASITIFSTPSTHLFYNNAIIQTESGVQQGDPLIPLLYQRTIKTSVPSLLQHNRYFDDGLIAGSENQINQKLEILANEGPERDLIFRKDKCGCGQLKI